MNTSDQTRAELVLNYLRDRTGAWVPGMEVMSAEVGGTRAGARIAELRAKGHVIDSRPDPTGRSDVWEYRYDRYVGFAEAVHATQPTRPAASWPGWRCTSCDSPPATAPERLLGNMGKAACPGCKKRMIFRQVG